LIDRIESGSFEENNIIKCLYRPFDKRYLYYKVGVTSRPASKVMKHLANKKNLSLIALRQSRKSEVGTFFLSQEIVNKDAISPFDIGTIFPLYLYPEKNEEDTLEGKATRKPNLDPKIVFKIAKGLKLEFTSEKRNNQKDCFAPIDLLDYIYAVLYNPTFRTNYKEFLKIDFPRVPYPVNKETFWQLVEVGSQLRQIHLMESPKIDELVTGYPIDGDNVVSRKMTKTSPGFVPNDSTQVGKVWINEQQYFDKVPLAAWECHIGGYQPAQKWLKDRHGRELTYDDILYYQKIIAALIETNTIMKKIDKIEIE